MSDALVTYRLEPKFTPEQSIWLEEYAKMEGMTGAEFLTDLCQRYVKETMPLCED
jgi:hypothetical protein